MAQKLRVTPAVIFRGGRSTSWPLLLAAFLATTRTPFSAVTAASTAAEIRRRTFLDGERRNLARRIFRTGPVVDSRGRSDAPELGDQTFRELVQSDENGGFGSFFSLPGRNLDHDFLRTFTDATNVAGDSGKVWNWETELRDKILSKAIEHSIAKKLATTESAPPEPGHESHDRDRVRNYVLKERGGDDARAHEVEMMKIEKKHMHAEQEEGSSGSERSSASSYSTSTATRASASPTTTSSSSSDQNRNDAGEFVFVHENEYPRRALALDALWTDIRSRLKELMFLPLNLVYAGGPLGTSIKGGHWVVIGIDWQNKAIELHDSRGPGKADRVSRSAGLRQELLKRAAATWAAPSTPTPSGAEEEQVRVKDLQSILSSEGFVGSMATTRNAVKQFFLGVIQNKVRGTRFVASSEGWLGSRSARLSADELAEKIRTELLAQVIADTLSKILDLHRDDSDRTIATSALDDEDLRRFAKEEAGSWRIVTNERQFQLDPHTCGFWMLHYILNRGRFKDYRDYNDSVEKALVAYRVNAVRNYYYHRLSLRLRSSSRADHHHDEVDESQLEQHEDWDTDFRLLVDDLNKGFINKYQEALSEELQLLLDSRSTATGDEEEDRSPCVGDADHVLDEDERQAPEDASDSDEQTTSGENKKEQLSEAAPGPGCREEAIASLQ